jgi:cardiolipin synthase
VSPLSRNRRTRLAGAALLLLTACSSGPHPDTVYFFEAKLDPSSQDFGRELSSVTGEPLVEGNRCRLLVNGDAIFGAMLDAIRNARATINVETYIFQSDATGTRFARAIEERARAGVHCRVLVDAWGSHTLSKTLEEEMKKAGIEFERFRPILLFHRLKNRTHRKLLVVDGRVAFVGGQGFDDRWAGNADSPKHWHDVAVAVEGPAVARIQSVFAENWIEVHRPVPAGPDDYPELAPLGDDGVMVLRSSFGERTSRAALGLDVLLHSASREILIESAYFIPDATTIGFLTDATRRGVRVEIVVPGERNNLGYVRRVSRSTYGALLEAGVRIFEYRPTMMHAKVALIDGLWCSIGSANIDSRSYFLNDEANVNVRSERIAAEVRAMFTADRAASDEITLAAWKGRSVGERIAEWFLGLFSSEL